jgi:hypothetical protein
MTSNKIQKNEIGGACSMCEGKRNAYRYLAVNPKERENLGDLSVNEW